MSCPKNCELPDSIISFRQAFQGTSEGADVEPELNKFASLNHKIFHLI